MKKEAEDLVFRALADPSRREILALLRGGPMTTIAITEHFKMTRFGIMKHLNALEEAKLVTVEKSGRERRNYLNAYTLQKVFERWIEPYESLWASKLDRMKERLEKIANE